MLSEPGSGAPHCVVVLDVHGGDDAAGWAAELASLGTLGWQETTHRGAGGAELRVKAYFPASSLATVAEHSWDRCGARLVAAEPFERRDWMAPFRRAARPFPLGARLTIDPGEIEAEGGGRTSGGSVAPESPAERRLLRLPARQAFGTGTHESTQLAIELLERLDLGAARVLDVGTGTGIVAFAARVFGAGFTCGFDVDRAAAFAARDNGRLNALPVPVYAGTAAALAARARFDVIVANVRPERLRGRYGELAARLAPAGRLVLSGFLAEEEPLARRIAEKCGLTVDEAASRGEWAAWTVS